MRTTEHGRCSYHTWRTPMHSSAAIRAERGLTGFSILAVGEITWPGFSSGVSGRYSRPVGG